MPDTPGTTHLAFTLNGKYLVTAGSDSSVRIFTVGEDDEPKTIDTNGDEHTGIVATVCIQTYERYHRLIHAE